MAPAFANRRTRAGFSSVLNLYPVFSNVESYWQSLGIKWQKSVRVRVRMRSLWSGLESVLFGAYPSTLGRM